jgi:SAM-dependent methyltransferase
MDILTKNINSDELEKAFSKAAKIYGNIPIENSQRSRLVASIAFGKGEHLLDIGSYVSIYPVVLRLLGMEITILDSFPQRRYPDKAEKIDYVIENIYKKLGINVIEDDAYSALLPENTFDRISAFEVFEHLVDSPRPILEQAYKSLRRGGSFIISTPNIARLGVRAKVLLGKSPLPKYSDFFVNGNPFTGHRREMTIEEMRWMLVNSGFEVEYLTTTNVNVPSSSNRALLKKLYHSFKKSFWFPPSLRGVIFAVGRKPYV